MKRVPLPGRLAPEFHVPDARGLRVPPHRLRAGDLERPYRGVRMRKTSTMSGSPYEQARERELALMRALACRLNRGEFFSHRSAALLWEVPLRHRPAPEIRLGAIAPRRAPRIRGVIAHSFTSDRAEITHKKGLSLLTPAYAFATLGALPLADLVAAGDHLVRMYRPGYGRRNADKPPLATIAQLSAAVELGRWTGMRTLRRALDLIREDSWSPRESTTRLALVLAGLPEPELNVDIYDSRGCFLSCVDTVYPEHKVIIEYQGAQHSTTYAEDVERFERLRAEAWEVIQVTNALSAQPARLVARVATALRARGWPGRVEAQSSRPRRGADQSERPDSRC